MSINVTEKYRCNCAPHTGVMCMFHYKMISECADLELVSKVEKLEQEIERLREAIMSCLSGTDITMSTFITLERALKVLEKSE